METSKFQIYFDGRRVSEGDFPFQGKTVSDCNSFERAAAKIEWNLVLVTGNLRAMYQPICVVEIDPEIDPEIVPPQVHVLAKKAVSALYQLQESWGLRVTDWNVDDSGSEIELEDSITHKKVWVSIGR